MNEFSGRNGRRLYAGRNLNRTISIDDLRARAHRRVPAAVMEYVEGGSDLELTLNRNRAAFQKLLLVQRVLRKVGEIDLNAPLLGRAANAPMAIAPTGFNGLLWPRGDLALATAAVKAGIPFAQSTVSNIRLEEIAKIPNLRHWMQLYVFKNMTAVEQIVKRAELSGAEALIVTADTAIFGNRTWDQRSYSKGTNLTFRRKLEALRHPHWMFEWMTNPIPGFDNLADAIEGGKTDVKTAGQWLRANLDPEFDWDKLRWIRKAWPRKLILKGIMSPQDASIAQQESVDAVVLSNHGGRQLDGSPAPVEMLKQARQNAPGLELLVDSGIRSGGDIVKALALGAQGVMIGRAGLYGLASGGEFGVNRALQILTAEMRRTLGLLGCSQISDLGDQHIHVADPEFFNF